MGNLCGGPDDLSRGLDSQGAQEMVVWGDHFSADTRAIIATLFYCSIDYRVQPIDSSLGEINEVKDVETL
jgi:hypothetical protein